MNKHILAAVRRLAGVQVEVSSVYISYVVCHLRTLTIVAKKKMMMLWREQNDLRYLYTTCIPTEMRALHSKM